MGYASQKIGSTQVSKRSNITNIRFHQQRKSGQKYTALTNSWQDRLSIGLSGVSSKYMAFFGISQISKIMSNI